MTRIPQPRRSAFAGDAGALMLGSVVNGLAAYAFVALGTRSFGAEAFAPVSVLWTFWAVTVAIFTFPVQHWIIRTVEVDGHEGSVGRALPRLVASVLVVSTGLALIAWVWRDTLFGSESVVWPVLVLIVGVGSAAAGYLRGVLAARRRFKAAGTAIGAENAVRLAAGIAIVAGGGSIEWFGAALAAGPLTLVIWPSVFALVPGRPEQDHRLGEFLAGLAGGVLLAQVALNAGPAVLAALGGSPADVTALFATLALFRAPYLVALGLATRFTGPLTALVTSGDEERLGAIRRWTGAGSVAAGVVGGAVGWLIGPELVDLIFGAGVAPSRPIVAAIAAGSALALVALGAILVLIARGAASAILAAWTAALAAGVVILLVPGPEPLDAVVVAFLAVEVMALGAMLWIDARLAVRAR